MEVEGNLVTSSISLAAAETVVSSLSAGKMVMTYNEDHSGKITYNNNSRQIFRGASMMGFAQVGLFDGTKSIGRVLPPSEWAVLWGDPSVTRSRANPQNVYMVNIAIPANKFTGTINGPVQTSTPQNFCNAYIGGACVARSSDGGRNFSLTNNDCVRRTSSECPFGTFYDGSDTDTSPEGRIYIAFVDAWRNRIDVWMAGGHNSPFTRLTDPPAPPAGAGHPRIKYGPGGLYLVYPSGSSLLITRYTGGASTTGSWTPNVTVPNVNAVSAMLPFQPSSRSLRLGPEFDFDIGLVEGGSTGARIVHTNVTAAGKLFVAVKSCLTDPARSIICQDRGSGWMTTGLTGDQFNPTIAVTPDSNIWWISFLNTNATVNRTVELWSGQATVGFQGVGSLRVRREVAAQTPCPDLRGYWGHYDSMAIGVGLAGYRGFTDSTITTCEQFQFHAQPQRASLASWTTSF